MQRYHHPCSPNPLHKSADIRGHISDEKIAKRREAQRSPEARNCLRLSAINAHPILHVAERECWCHQMSATFKIEPGVGFALAAKCLLDRPTVQLVVYFISGWDGHVLQLQDVIIEIAHDLDSINCRLYLEYPYPQYDEQGVLTDQPNCRRTSPVNEEAPPSYFVVGLLDTIPIRNCPCHDPQNLQAQMR